MIPATIPLVLEQLSIATGGDRQKHSILLKIIVELAVSTQKFTVTKEFAHPLTEFALNLYELLFHSASRREGPKEEKIEAITGLTHLSLIEYLLFVSIVCFFVTPVTGNFLIKRKRNKSLLCSRN